MLTLAMAFGLMGLSFGRLGASNRHAAAGGGGGGSSPTYHIYGF